MKKTLLLTILISCNFLFSQQLYTGYTNDNNAGVTSVYNQPAALVDSKTKFNITTSFALINTNNFNGVNFNLLFNPLNNQTSKYRRPVFNGYKSTNFSVDLLGISYELNHENAIGYSLRYRSLINTDGIPDELTQFEFDNYNNPNFTGPTSVELKKFNYNSFNYLEHMFNYARVIYNEKDRFLKAGVAFKIINGINAGYYFADGQVDFTNSNSTSFSNTNVQYGKADNSAGLDKRRDGFGFDLGVVYEYRPDYMDYKYDMDGEKNIERYDKKKYKYKIGISLTDIGRVKFNKDTTNLDFNTSAPFNAVSLEGGLFSNPINYINNSLQPATSTIIANDQKSTFKMSLPTSFNVQIDYLVIKDFYVNYSTAISVKLAKDPNKVHQKAIHTLTPRIEKDKFSIMLPLSLQNNAQFNVGFAGRYLMGKVNLFMGTNNLTFLFGKRTIYTTNYFVGANYNIFYTVPSDIDGDKISDPFDDCIYDPGLAALNGCPDTDGDGIPDKDDYCIYDAGPQNTFGCPDTDGDGVIDLNDQCPESAGLAIHYGCPDSDHDGVIDVADQCPDVPGVELNNGCPFEITNCCLDDDGDAVPNSSDKCPTIPGSVYNSGCPIDKNNINTIGLNEVKDTMDANHTNEHVDLIESPLRDTSMVEGLSNVLDDMSESNYITATNVYFKSDDATIKDEYQSNINNVIDNNKDSKVTYVIIGHTDNRGTDNYNLILSKKRAEVVRRSLINRGVDAAQIVIYYYGEWKPSKSNENTAERKFNRRVEIRVYESE